VKTTLTALALALASLTALPCHAAEDRRSTAADQTSLAVTIYNGDLALVKDARKVKLGGGDSLLAWRDVSAHMQPETALLHALDGSKLTLLEQTFDFDPLTPKSLLEKSVGDSVRVIRTQPITGAEFSENATILAANDGVVLQFMDRVETVSPGRLAFSSVPLGLHDRPTLSMLINTDGPSSPYQTTEHRLELSYLTSGLTWKADYVANLSDKEDQIDLNGWAMLTNTSGTTYTNAQLQLVAGEVNRVPPEHARAPVMARAMAAAEAAPAMPQEKLLEYHLYTLARPTTLKDNQSKQVALFTAQGVKVGREYRLEGSNWYYNGQYSDLGRRIRPSMYLVFNNTADNHLGIPLPKGIVRVYKKDSSGDTQFVGEDRLDQTAKGEEVRLKLGEASDITADKRQTNFQKLNTFNAQGGLIETAYQLDIRNAKNAAVTIRVVEPMPGDWQILQESHPHKQDVAHAATWDLSVPAEGMTSLTWRVRIKY
jgi:hypothetical protein